MTGTKFAWTRILVGVITVACDILVSMGKMPQSKEDAILTAVTAVGTILIGGLSIRPAGVVNLPSQASGNVTQTVETPQTPACK